MKNAGWVVVVLLQVACLVALLGQRTRESGNDAAEQIAALRADLSGALNQQRTLTLYLDELRGDLQRLLKSGVSTPSVAGADRSEQTPAATADPSSASEPSSTSTEDDVEVPEGTAFPQAYRAMVLLKRNHALLEKEAEEPAPFLAPLEQRRDELRSQLLRLGQDSLHWIHDEATRPPYDAERAPSFVVYLMRELVPSLAASNPAGTYDLVRDVMLDSTHTSAVRQAAGDAMLEVSPSLWADQYLDMISKGTSREVPLRVHLLHAFLAHPDSKVVPLCQQLLEEPRHPPQLRTEAVRVLAAQSSALANPLLHKVIFEDHTPEIRAAALSELADRLDEAGKRNLLEEVLGKSDADMHQMVLELAQRMLDGLGG